MGLVAAAMQLLGSQESLFIGNVGIGTNVKKRLRLIDLIVLGTVWIFER